MSVYLGTQLLSGVATNTISNGHSLFDFKWTDHIINEMSWLRSDTFSWQDGSVYDFAYNHLNADYNGGTSTTETIGSYTITYVLADDGHKITTDETTVENIYNESGVAWYYILDTANQRFKLPRTKYGFVGTRDTVGNYVPESLPNITGTLSIHGKENSYLYCDGATGAFSATTGKTTTSGYRITGESNSNPKFPTMYFDASDSSATYENNAPVQERATQMYLYFYVGQFSQSATEQTAGLNSELFNGKADVDLSNMNPSATAKATICGLVVPDYDNPTALSASLSSGNTTVNVLKPSYIFIRTTNANNCYTRMETSGGTIVTMQYINISADKGFGMSAILPTGTYTINATTSGGYYNLFPLKGVS